MHNEEKSIYNLYESSANANHTTRSADAYTYSPVDYSYSREESEEDSGLNKKITQTLKNCLHYCQAGNKEGYAKLLFDIKKIENIVQSLILKK